MSSAKKKLKLKKTNLFQILGPLGAFDVELRGCVPEKRHARAQSRIISKNMFRKIEKRKEEEEREWSVTGRRN